MPLKQHLNEPNSPTTQYHLLSVRAGKVPTDYDCTDTGDYGDGSRKDLP